MDNGLDLNTVPDDLFTNEGEMTTMWSKYGDCAPIVYRSAEAIRIESLLTAEHVDDAVKERPIGHGKIGTKFCYGREAINALIMDESAWLW